MHGLRIVLLGTLAACGGAAAGGGGGGGAGPRPTDAKACGPTAEATGAIRWYTDDYAAATACAKATRRPLFIDLWAPWCHTCLSMKSYVFPDPGMKTMADRFVWLAIDTDVELNAAVLARFPPEAWPTYFVVDADDESIQSRYVGAASTTQLREFLREAELAYVGAREGGLAADDPIRLLREGVQAEATGDLITASKKYGMALANAPSRWPRRPDVLVSRVRVLAGLEDWPTCAAFGAGAADQTGDTASVTDFAYYALECAAHLTDAAQKKSLYTLFEARLARLVADEAAPLSVDDRADALRTLRDARTELGDKAGARAAAEAGKALLDQAAADAPNPLAASTHNYLRADFYAWLGLDRQLVPILEKSAADLPNEYDPAYRLAGVYLNLGDTASALRWAEKALALSYGPRKARVQATIAGIHQTRGDKPAELAARRAVVKILEDLPEGQQQPKQLEAARKALADAEKR